MCRWKAGQAREYSRSMDDDTRSEVAVDRAVRHGEERRAVN